MRVVVFKDGEAWIAQCLEHDICAQASDLPSLWANLEATVEQDRAHSLKLTGAEFGGIDKAPDHFFKMWDACETRVDPAGDHHYEMAMCA